MAAWGKGGQEFLFVIYLFFLHGSYTVSTCVQDSEHLTRLRSSKENDNGHWILSCETPWPGWIELLHVTHAQNITGMLRLSVRITV